MRIKLDQLSRLPALLAIIALALLPAAATAAEPVADYTNLFYEPSHGTQLEYLSPDGKAYLWYPGNSVILEGRWKRENADICFAYGENTYNPVTGTRGGAWECSPYALSAAAIIQRAPGDPFALTGRQAVPFVLDPRQTTMEDIQARMAR